MLSASINGRASQTTMDITINAALHLYNVGKQRKKKSRKEHEEMSNFCSVPFFKLIVNVSRKKSDRIYYQGSEK